MDIILRKLTITTRDYLRSPCVHFFFKVIFCFVFCFVLQTKYKIVIIFDYKVSFLICIQMLYMFAYYI